MLWMLLAVIACDEKVAQTNIISESSIDCQDAEPDTLMLFVDNVDFEESVQLMIDVVNDPRHVRCETIRSFDEDDEEFSIFECFGSGPRIEQFFEEGYVEIELSGYAPETFFLFIALDEEPVYEAEISPEYVIHTSADSSCMSRHGELEVIL